MPEIPEPDLWIAGVIIELCSMIEKSPGFSMDPGRDDHLDEVAAVLRTQVYALGAGQMGAMASAEGSFLDSVDPGRN